MARFVVNREAIEALDYRQFIMAVLRSGDTVVPRGNLSHLARRSGLSKGFLTEVIQGKKSLSPLSLNKLSEGMGLRGETKRLFGLLVSVDLPNVRETFASASEVDVRKKLNHLKLRLLQKQNSGGQPMTRQKPLLSFEVFLVYAGLGSPEKGATLSEIFKKTNVEPSRAMKIIEMMIELGWVNRVGDHYFANQRSLDLRELGEDLGFIQAFAESSLELSENSKEINNDPEKLAFLSTLSMNPARLKELKERLRSAILEIVEDFQDEDGEVVRRINLGMF